jgi:hypothetical protein
MLLPPQLRRRLFLASCVPALVLTLAEATAAGREARPPVEVGAVVPEREVLPLLQAWRRAEECAAAIPGGEALVGRGDSMLPIYPDSTVLVVRRMQMEELRPGMVVVFMGDSGRPVAHTLIAGGPRGWTVKGAGNVSVDRTLVRSQNYLGTVVRAFLPFLPEAAANAAPAERAAGRKPLETSPRAAVTVALSGT